MEYSKEDDEKMNKIKLDCEIRISPAFDKRSKTPGKNYGIHACEIWFIVKGKKGALTLHFGTNWYLKSTIDSYKNRECNNKYINLENGDSLYPPLKVWSLDYHKPTKEKTGYLCEFIGNRRCKTDGSYCYAEKYDAILREKGSEGVFKEMKKDYRLWLR